ncbi:hypothetical protein [Paenibacillus sp. y28]|uniref:hypothetical protein n=1 Tax=Paenibacillus sp. y28 TaxID=3129110 RepID=UPI00301AACF8
MSKQQYSLGWLIIVIGAIIVLGKLGVFHFLGKVFWPLLLLIPGLLLHYLFFNRRFSAAMLVPGGILVSYGALFLFCTVFGWWAIRWLWPLLILGVALGLYEYYWFDRNPPRGVYVASMALGILSALLFFFIFFFSIGIYFIAAVLVISGIYLVVSRKK